MQVAATVPEHSHSVFARAAHALHEGLLVAFPTETVYGLGADAGNAAAIKRLYAAKGRPSNHPVIVHIYCLEQLTEFTRHVPEPALTLAQKYWPGPLTLILPRAAHVLDEITGGQDTVALRIPDHPVALALLREFKKGVAAPSANRFGKLSPTTAADVRSQFGEHEVAMVLDGGSCSVGLESTIVDFSGFQSGEHCAVRILRPGMLLKRQIEETLQVKINGVKATETTETTDAQRTKVRVPGSLRSHYAPSTPLKIVSLEALDTYVAALSAKSARFSVISFHKAESGTDGCLTENSTTALEWIVADNDPYGYARDLYGCLHRLDGLRGDIIVVEQVPDAPEWTAIADRLQRAAAII